MNQQENETGVSTTSYGTTSNARSGMAQFSNYISNMFASGFSFTYSYPIPKMINKYLVQEQQAKLSYEKKMYVYQYVISVLRRMHMQGLYPVQTTPLSRQVYIFENKQGVTEPMLICKGYSSCMPSSTECVVELVSVLNLQVMVPNNYQELIFPQAQQFLAGRMVGKNKEKNDLEQKESDEKSLEQKALEAIAVIASVKREVLSNFHKFPGKLIMNKDGVIYRPFEIMEMLTKRPDEANPQQASNKKLHIDDVFRLVLLYFHLQKQIETFRYLPDELQDYLYIKPGKDAGNDDIEYDFTMPNAYIENSRNSEMVIKPWARVEITKDLPSFFVDHINSIGTEFTPMQVLRLVLGLSEYPVCYSLSNDILPIVYQRAKLIEILSKMPEYYVNAFLQACYVCAEVQDLPGNPLDYAQNKDRLLKVNFTPESIRQFIDDLK